MHLFSNHLSMIRTLTTLPLRSISLSTAKPRTLLLNNFKIGSSLSTTSAVNMASAKQFVDEGIKKNHVMVYGKSYCPVCLLPPILESLLILQYCQRAKKLLEGETSEMEYIDLDKRDDGCELPFFGLFVPQTTADNRSRHPGLPQAAQRPGYRPPRLHRTGVHRRVLRAPGCPQGRAQEEAVQEVEVVLQNNAYNVQEEIYTSMGDEVT